MAGVYLFEYRRGGKPPTGAGGIVLALAAGALVVLRRRPTGEKVVPTLG